MTDFLEHHRAGKVKILFTSGTKPSSSSPDIPTATMLGYPNLQFLGWYVFWAPAKLSERLVEAWGAELRTVLAMPDVQKRLSGLGLDVETSTPAAFRQRMVHDLAQWQTVIDLIGYKPT